MNLNLVCARDLKRMVDQTHLLANLAPPFSEAVQNIPRHVPCPVHGGKDGFRIWLSNNDIRGICNSCHSGKALDVYDLISWINGWSFSETLSQANHLVGAETCLKKQLKPVSEIESGKRQKILDAWKAGFKITAESPQGQYLRRRIGAEVSFNFDSLRASTLRYWENVNGSNQCFGHYPVILALITDPKDEIVNLHRIYVTADGKKAPVGNPKKTMPSPTTGATLGCSVHLGHCDERLYVCEGLETGLAINCEKRSPVWCALTAGSLEIMHIPMNVKELIICADKDRSERGEQAGRKLAQRFLKSYPNKKVKIILPSLPIPDHKKGVDWLDQLSSRGGDG